MKKVIRRLTILITILLILFIIISKKTEPFQFKYNNIYTKQIYNYINDKLYSITTETITLTNGILNYEAKIEYNDTKNQPITIEYINKYEEKQDRIITRNKTYYIDDEKICLESIDCKNPYTKSNYKIDNKISNFNKEDYITIRKRLTIPTKTEMLVILDPNDKETKKMLNKIIYDFNINISIIELNKKNKDELKDAYNITKTPCYIIYTNNFLNDIEENITTHEELALYLFLKGIDYR